MSEQHKKGGEERARRLAPDERSKIASEGGKARAEAMAGLPSVDYPGILKLGAASIPCAVLSDGRRVLSETGIAAAILGGRSGASKRLSKAAKDSGAHVPIFVAPGQLKDLITKDILEGPLKPIKYRDGRRIVTGYDARVLRVVCEIWLKARAAGYLQKQQLEKAQSAELLMRALADVGLIALVDEVTGYQKVRARQELQQILSAYIAPELLPYTSRFPDIFYEELHRVRGWKYEPGSSKRTAYIGKLTNSLIYEQMPKGVLDELKSKNPINPITKRRGKKHFQFLTDDIGSPHLEKQIASVVTLLRISDGWSDFTKHFSRAFPPGPGDLFALQPPSDDDNA